ncbi:hypothetical protein vseg_004221 [Gypsophila vaccaria]
MGSSRRVLVVGNHCHDVLLKNGVVLAESLGGAVSFISNILPPLSVPFDLVSKVGPDFNYTPLSHPNNNNNYDDDVPAPVVVPTAPTTVFHAHFGGVGGGGGGDHKGSDRTLRRVAACDPILPRDIPEGSVSGRYSFGMAVGVGGEILPTTLQKMLRVCDVVFVDVQGLIRKFGDDDGGTVTLTKLCGTVFHDILPGIGVLKASAEEAEFIDVEEVRKVCCVVVTYGEEGCRVFWKDGEVGIGPFSTVQVDPTGAGDSLLGGLVAGVVHGLSLPDAALLGNFFGSLTVSQFGLPKFDPRLLKRVRDEVQKRSVQCAKHRVGVEDELWFSKPPGHEEFHAALESIRQAYDVSPQQVERGLSDLHDQVTRPINACINHLYNGKVVRDHLYDEPIQSVEGTPSLPF